MRDLERALQRERLAEKTLHPLAAAQPDAADAQRRRHRCHEPAETVFRNRPHLDVDPWPFEMLFPHETRFRRVRPRQCKEPIVASGTRGMHEARTTIRELMV